MSEMVFCRGCGQSIHTTAPNCPQCGAPQHINKLNGDWGNAMAWIIACAPLIGAFSEGLVIELFNYSGILLFLVSVGINIFLCTQDEKSLREKGVDTTQLGNVWLVPIYLFNRARVLKEKLGYPILWCVLFLAQINGTL